MSLILITAPRLDPVNHDGLLLIGIGVGRLPGFVHVGLPQTAHAHRSPAFLHPNFENVCFVLAIAFAENVSTRKFVKL